MESFPQSHTPTTHPLHVQLAQDLPMWQVRLLAWVFAEPFPQEPNVAKTVKMPQNVQCFSGLLGGG